MTKSIPAIRELRNAMSSRLARCIEFGDGAGSLVSLQLPAGSANGFGLGLRGVEVRRLGHRLACSARRRDASADSRALLIGGGLVAVVAVTMAMLGFVGVHGFELLIGVACGLFRSAASLLGLPLLFCHRALAGLGVISPIGEPYVCMGCRFFAAVNGREICALAGVSYFVSLGKIRSLRKF